jgi:hypothetical protein
MNIEPGLGNWEEREVGMIDLPLVPTTVELLNSYRENGGWIAPG